MDHAAEIESALPALLARFYGRVRQDDQLGAFESALDRLAEAARHADVLIPGHGAVAEGPEVAARIAADRAYIDALRQGEEPVDARLETDWLAGIHQANVEQARARSAS